MNIGSAAVIIYMKEKNIFSLLTEERDPGHSAKVILHYHKKITLFWCQGVFVQ